MTTVDEKLADATARREAEVDNLVRAMVAIDTLTTRIDTLLDRKAASK